MSVYSNFEVFTVGRDSQLVGEAVQRRLQPAQLASSGLPRLVKVTCVVDTLTHDLEGYMKVFMDSLLETVGKNTVDECFKTEVHLVYPSEDVLFPMTRMGWTVVNPLERQRSAFMVLDEDSTDFDAKIPFSLSRGNKTVEVEEEGSWVMRLRYIADDEEPALSLRCEGGMVLSPRLEMMLGTEFHELLVSHPVSSNPGKEPVSTGFLSPGTTGLRARGILLGMVAKGRGVPVRDLGDLNSASTNELIQAAEEAVASPGFIVIGNNY